MPGISTGSGQGLPTSTVTFLFTDIEGSTKRWEQYPKAMQAALARHDAILREAIIAHGGYVFKTMGDAFCAAFSSTSDALNAALWAQRATYDENWGEVGPIRVRIALHTGAAEERDGDYFGQSLNRVARLLSAGHGGQTLLSFSSFELVRDTLPEGIALRDMGERRLKDLIRPERVYQVVAPDFPSEFAPLKTLDYRPNNLPAQPTALIGREKELTEIAGLLRTGNVRLVTLIGPGGTGKTRLGLQAAADLLDEFENGVWFVDLSPITDSRLVVSEVAQTLGVQEASGKPLIESIKDFLRDKQMLLVLDNFEQLTPAARDVAHLMQAAVDLKVLVTSRAALRLRGEKEFLVPPLVLPDIDHLPPLERLTQYEAVRLFIERALDVRPDFEVDNDNAPSVAEICVRLDGLPLAIELAAARIKILTPQAMLSRLQSRLKMLTGGAKDLPARQQTLRNTIEWSYDLLDVGEQQFFRRMAVFQGGRILEALEVVCNYDGLLKEDVLDGVESLVSKSLLRRVEGLGGEPRFWMLETIHEYAREKLEESGESEALQWEHALYFMNLAEDAEPELVGARQAEWLHRLEEEHDNLRAALRWVSGKGEQGDDVAGEATEVGLRTAGALRRFWDIRGYYNEGRIELDKVLSIGGGSEGSRAKALAGAGVLARLQSDYAGAQSLSTEGLDIYRRLGDDKGIVLALNTLGIAAWYQGNYAIARTLHEEVLEIRRTLDDKQGLTIPLVNLGLVARDQGDHARARELYQEGLAIHREMGNSWGVANTLLNLGIVARDEGNLNEARSLYEESLGVFQELKHKWSISLALYNLGVVAQDEGNCAEAYLRYTESLRIRHELEDKPGIAECLEGVASLPGSQGSPERAARLRGAAESLREAIATPLSPADLAYYEDKVTVTRAQLSEEEFEKAWAEGRAMSME